MAPDAERPVKNTPKLKVYLIHFSHSFFCTNSNCSREPKKRNEKESAQMNLSIWFSSIADADNGCYRADIAFEIDWFSLRFH